MLIDTFVLSCCVIFLLKISLFEASKLNPGGAEDIEGKMRQKNVGGRPAVSPGLASGSRKKRDLIDPSLFNPDWVPDQYFGVRTDTLITIINSFTYTLDQQRAYSMGVRISSKLILTLCSAVTYSIDPNAHVIAWVHSPFRTPVFKCLAKDIKVNVMDWVNHGRPTSIDVIDVLIHPDCDNWYDTDVAVLVVENPLPQTRNVWIHSAENLMFRRNLDRVVAAQGVLGKCVVPVFRNESNSLTVEYVKVNFQNWFACRANVCPWWGRGGKPIWQDPRRCNNLLNGTKFCVSWELITPLCDLPPGTPIFCDVGDIHGLMGLLVNETLLCNPFDNYGIITSLVDALDWIRDVIQIRYNKKYESSIPAWMSNLRENYTSHYVPRLRVLTTTAPSPVISFDHFTGDQIHTLVTVYVDKTPQCIATMVTFFIGVLPCSCLTVNDRDMDEPINIRVPDPFLLQVEAEKILVGTYSGDSSVPKSRVTNYELHPKCDSHYEMNYGLILLEKSIPGIKPAWIMTAHEKVFGNLLRVVAVADQSMGYDCYWVDTYKRKKNTRTRNKIRFVHWTNCIANICPRDPWLVYQKERCYHMSHNHSMYCIRSVDSKNPACNLRDGTPIFCNVEAARGFVGFISVAMDLRKDVVPCRSRALEDQTVVLTGIDTYLTYFKQYTFINEMEVFVRDQYQRSSSSIPVLSLFVVCTLLFIVSKN